MVHPILLWVITFNLLFLCDRVHSHSLKNFRKPWGVARSWNILALTHLCEISKVLAEGIVLVRGTWITSVLRARISLSSSSWDSVPRNILVARLACSELLQPRFLILNEALCWILLVALSLLFLLPCLSNPLENVVAGWAFERNLSNFFFELYHGAVISILYSFYFRDLFLLQNWKLLALVPLSLWNVSLRNWSCGEKSSHFALTWVGD